MDRKVGHHRRYTRAGLLSLLRQIGFIVDRVDYADSLGFLASLIYRWVDVKSGDINEKALLAYDRAVFPVSLLLDRFCRHWFSKNLAVVAARPA